MNAEDSETYPLESISIESEGSGVDAAIHLGDGTFSVATHDTHDASNEAGRHTRIGPCTPTRAGRLSEPPRSMRRPRSFMFIGKP